LRKKLCENFFEIHEKHFFKLIERIHIKSGFKVSIEEKLFKVLRLENIRRNPKILLQKKKIAQKFFKIKKIFKKGKLNNSKDY